MATIKNLLCPDAGGNGPTMSIPHFANSQDDRIFSSRKNTFHDSISLRLIGNALKRSAVTLLKLSATIPPRLSTTTAVVFPTRHTNI